MHFLITFLNIFTSLQLATGTLRTVYYSLILVLFSIILLFSTLSLLYFVSHFCFILIYIFVEPDKATGF